MKYILLSAILFFLFGCNHHDDVLISHANEKEIISFAVLKGNDTIPLTVTDSTIEGIIPDTTSREKLAAIFSYKGKQMTIEGSQPVSSTAITDFRKPVHYCVQAENGSIKTYTVKLRSFTGIPIMYITSPPITSKDVYVTGTIKIDGNFDYPDGNYSIQIKGRGNSTWGNPKNPYKMKLAEKVELLGMPADKEWALLANWFDKSLLRNDLAFELSERLKLAWTPKRRFVEVFLNGQYNGSYLLTETVKTGKDRLNIPLMDAKNANDTTNGYLVEADWRQDATQTFVTNSGIRFSMKEPEVVTNSQLSYITRQMNTLLNSIAPSNDLSSMIDVDSWIKWTIVNEVMRNRDATLFGSCFFYQGANAKLFMGPVWDFDLSAGDYEGNDPAGWYVTTADLVGQAFRVNGPYRQRFKEIWNENKEKIASLPQYLFEQEAKIKYSQQQNFQRWPVMSTSLYDGQITASSYEEETEHLRDFLARRFDWMDKEFNK